MKKTLFLLCMILAPLGTGALRAQEHKPTLNISSSAKVTAKADLAIVFMTVRSTSPLAADALEQNNKKVQAVKDRLLALGFREDQLKFSGNRFAPAGGRVAVYGDQRSTGFDVTNNLFVYLEGPDLKDLQQFNTRLGGLLDELSKLGASPLNVPISTISMGGTSVVAFTVKDPSALEKRAYQQALDNARPLADEIAHHMQVQITGVASVSIQQQGPMQARLESSIPEIPFQYLSSSLDEVPIRVSVYVVYNYQ
jgi:uncharacterized protein YggE